MLDKTKNDISIQNTYTLLLGRVRDRVGNELTISRTKHLLATKNNIKIIKLPYNVVPFELHVAVLTMPQIVMSLSQKACL